MIKTLFSRYFDFTTVVSSGSGSQRSSTQLKAPAYPGDHCCVLYEKADFMGHHSEPICLTDQQELGQSDVKFTFAEETYDLSD